MRALEMEEEVMHLTEENLEVRMNMKQLAERNL